MLLLYRGCPVKTYVVTRQTISHLTKIVTVPDDMGIDDVREEAWNAPGEWVRHTSRDVNVECEEL